VSIDDRLGYLFKHAHARLTELTAEALQPYGISGRELAVLIVLAGQGPASQQEAAGRLGIDRTTMVAFVDALEAKGLVARRPDPADRRRNVVVLTPGGEDTLSRAKEAGEEAERRFLAPLTGSAADQLRRALKTIVTARSDGPSPGAARSAPSTVDRG
jgi:DNA-binding MarR family transcriptional regulator